MQRPRYRVRLCAPGETTKTNFREFPLCEVRSADLRVDCLGIARDQSLQQSAQVRLRGGIEGVYRNRGLVTCLISG